MAEIARTRSERQAGIDARAADLRARADAKDIKANRLLGVCGSTDLAYSTQPVFSNAAGRALSRSREADRNAYLAAGRLTHEANELREHANALQARDAVVAGDAAKARQTAIQACSVEVGQMVDTTHYGIRKVLKVNKVSVLVEGSFGPLKVEKQYVRAA